MKSKRFVRAAAIFLCVCALFALPSCSQKEGEIPSGMKSATCKGEHFRLYVPSTWNVNTSYGVSGAYYVANEQSTVSVVGYDVDAAELETLTGGARIQWYFENYVYVAMTEVADEGTLVAHTDDFADTTLDGVNAKRYHHTLEHKGNELHFLHVVAEKGGRFYVFSFTATEKYYNDLYDSEDSDVKWILKEFKFASKGYKPEEAPKEEMNGDVTPPDGMKIASTKEVAYLFFVPKAWDVNVQNDVYSASVDGAVVSVVPYQPNTPGVSVKSYAESCEKLLKDAVASYEALVRFEKTKLGGGQALLWEYRYTMGGTTYRGRQIMVGYGGMIYSVTYTAFDDTYDLYLQDAMRIFDEFAFRRS